MGKADGGRRIHHADLDILLDAFRGFRRTRGHMDVRLWSEIDLAHADKFGGKAAGLLKLTAFQAPVPAFLVVSPDAFYRHLPKALFEEFIAEENADIATAIATVRVAVVMVAAAVLTVALVFSVLVMSYWLLR